MGDQEESEFVIKDKRASKQSEEEAKASDETRKEEASQAGTQEAAAAGEFEINFSQFVLSLASSAFYHMGDLADPITGKKEENLPAVKQTIDILIMLREKTKNNLDAEESKMIEQLIYELQMKYMAKQPK